MIDRLYSLFGIAAKTPGSARSRRGILLIRVTVSLLIVAQLLWWLPTRQIMEGIARVPASYWLLLVAAFLMVHCAAALKWRFLLGVVDAPVSRSLSIRAHGAGLFANLCLPSIVGGDFVRAAIVAKSGTPLTNIAVGGLADRLIDSVALVIIATAGAWTLALSTDWITPLQSTLLLTVCVGLLVSVGFAIGIVLLVPQRQLPETLHATLNKIRTSLQLLVCQPRAGLLALLVSTLLQIALIGLNILLAEKLGLSIAWALWFFAWPMAKLVSLVPVSLGGIGVRDAALLTLLSPYVSLPALVIAQSFSWQIVLIAAGVLAGLLAGFLPVSRQDTPATQPPNGLSK